MHISLKYKILFFPEVYFRGRRYRITVKLTEFLHCLFYVKDKFKEGDVIRVWLPFFLIKTLIDKKIDKNKPIFVNKLSRVRRTRYKDLFIQSEKQESDYKAWSSKTPSKNAMLSAFIGEEVYCACGKTETEAIDKLIAELDGVKC